MLLFHMHFSFVLFPHFTRSFRNVPILCGCCYLSSSDVSIFSTEQYLHLTSGHLSFARPTGILNTKFLPICAPVFMPYLICQLSLVSKTRNHGFSWFPLLISSLISLSLLNPASVTPSLRLSGVLVCPSARLSVFTSPASHSSEPLSLPALCCCLLHTGDLILYIVFSPIPSCTMISFCETIHIVFFSISSLCIHLTSDGHILSHFISPVWDHFHELLCQCCPTELGCKPHV